MHLRPDLYGVLLADARVLAIEPVEAALLAAAFDQTFAAEGLQLRVPRPDRWYLRLPADPGFRTHPLLDAIGRDINPLLPYGPSAPRWHALLTEIQMLFHQHPVNRVREERNQPLINSIWFWGGGACPTGVRAPAADLYANDPLTRAGTGSVECDGQQPNQCVYTPGGPPTAVYSPRSGELAGPDGVRYSVENSTKTGDDGWKEMLAPAG